MIFLLCSISIILLTWQLRSTSPEAGVYSKEIVYDRLAYNGPFVFDDNFSFPQPKVMRSLKTIQESLWMRDLRMYLDSLKLPVGQIFLLTSNIKYVDVLLNWLISACVRNNIPTQNILIISLDYNVHMILQRRKFNSILIIPNSILSPKFKFSQPFEMVMMLRLTLMRIINHFGFNVAMLDTDAIMLKDPRPLFDALPSMDIIGSLGTIPADLFAEWNVTICIGMVLVKSTERTGNIFTAM